jgi:hypothetical protein
VSRRSQQFNSKPDGNQKLIVSVLRKVGFHVRDVKDPYDVDVARHMIRIAVEIKNPERPPSGRRLTDNEWNYYNSVKGFGLYCVIETQEDVYGLRDAVDRGLRRTYLWCDANMSRHFATCYKRRGEANG